MGAQKILLAVMMSNRSVLTVCVHLYSGIMSFSGELFAATGSSRTCHACTVTMHTFVSVNPCTPPGLFPSPPATPREGNTGNIGNTREIGKHGDPGPPGPVKPIPKSPTIRPTILRRIRFPAPPVTPLPPTAAKNKSILSPPSL